MSKFEFKRWKGFKVDEFFKDNFDTTGIDDNIYNQIAKDMARCIDIDLAKTPLVDILTGYTRYKEAEYELQQKENIIKEVRELAIIKKARVENEPDYSKSYLKGYENAIQTQHLSHSGVMLETIKSTIKTTCNDFLEILDKENSNGSN